MYWRWDVSDLGVNEAQMANYLRSVALNRRVGELHLIDVTILDKHGKHTLPVAGYTRVRVSISDVELDNILRTNHLNWGKRGPRR